MLLPEPPTEAHMEANRAYIASLDLGADWSWDSALSEQECDHNMFAKFMMGKWTKAHYFICADALSFAVSIEDIHHVIAANHAQKLTPRVFRFASHAQFRMGRCLGMDESDLIRPVPPGFRRDEQQQEEEAEQDAPGDLLSADQVDRDASADAGRAISVATSAASHSSRGAARRHRRKLAATARGKKLTIVPSGRLRLDSAGAVARREAPQRLPTPPP